MRTCPTCQQPNPDESSRCRSCGGSLDAAAAGVDPFARARTMRRIRALVVGLLVLGAAGFAVWYSGKNRASGREVLAVLEPFVKADKESYTEFWLCLMRSRLATVRDNAALERAIESAWGKSKLTYHKHIADKCLPKLADAAKGVEVIKAPGGVQSALDAYRKTADLVRTAAERYAQAIERQALARDDKKINAGADALHRLAMGEDAAEAFGYEGFLRCSVPNLDAIDSQAWLQTVFESCKKEPKPYAAKLRACAAQMTATKASPTFKPVLQKFGEDARDIEALTDCFMRANKVERRELMEAISQAWLEYMKARDGVLQSIKQARGG